ncbi:MAG: glycosyltransferase family 4 protein [Candidatus Eisenbacteria bacterium]|nr:glycosyltransferase family 4 protein [Candidatus Eisenbacteria bacterium]
MGDRAVTIRRVFLAQWWFADAGGMEQHTANLASALKRKGIEVVVFSQMPMRRGSHYGRQLRREGIRVVAPPGWLRGAALSKQARKTVRRALWGLLSPLIAAERLSWKVRGYPGSKRDMVDVVNEIVFCDYSRRLARGMLDRHQRRRPADLIHVHGFRLDHAWALRWARERGVPSVYTEHGTITDWGSLWEDDAPENLLLADVITCVSERSRESLYDFIPRSVPVEIIPHIVGGLGEAGARRKAAPHPSPSSTVRITCFGRLQAEKGAEPLVRAMREVVDREPRALLILAGNGPDREKLKALASELGLESRVRFLGGFAPSELEELMADTDIVVLPSLTEGLPITLSEAMAFAKPIVATRVGGIPERIRHEANGLLVEPGDPAALARGILRFARDESLRERLGAAARRDYEANGLRADHALEAVLDLYAAAAERRSSRGKEASR